MVTLARPATKVLDAWCDVTPTAHPTQRFARRSTFDGWDREHYLKWRSHELRRFEEWLWCELRQRGWFYGSSIGPLRSRERDEGWGALMTPEESVGTPEGGA